MAIIVLDEVTMKACRCLTREDVLKFFNSLEAGEPHPVSDNGSEHDGIFHPALDLPKVKAALWRVLDARGRNGKRLFRLQKQWYVVYKVMGEMDWLDKPQGTRFRLWAADVFGERGRCKKADFDAIVPYYRNNASRNWKQVPRKEDPYAELAQLLWLTFWGEDGRLELQFLKPNCHLAHDL